MTSTTKSNFIRFLACIIACISILLCVGCNINIVRPSNKTANPTSEPTTKQVNLSTGIYAATDDLGRTVEYPSDASSATLKTNKEVGIFYFLWLGATSSEGPYDVSKIIANDPNAARSNDAWVAAGGGKSYTRHWWGESLYGYFRSIDPWVCERDVMLLTDAGIDFIIIDYSNGGSYNDQIVELLKALDKYARQGFNVPKVSFVTKSNSGEHINQIYEETHKKYPEYDYLWYRYDGKPLILGDNQSSKLTDEVKNYFTILWAQWPREEYHDDGFPWMDFKFPQTVYGKNMSKTVVSVSLAQHSGTIAFSSSAFYGDTSNHTRSWHNGANDTSEDAYLYGYNFAEQFEKAIELDPDIIFVTGWNEWIATRQDKWHDITDPIILVDNADINNSRDIQPMRGGYGDNYYMQLCSYIRKFKGYDVINSNLSNQGTNTIETIDVGGSFDQWNQVEPFYIDYTEDTTHRNCRGWGRLKYVNDTGRNDLYKMKVTSDSTNVYFYAETTSAIVGMDGEHCMSVFLNTGSSGANWYGYDYVIGRKMATNGGLVLEKRTESGWEEIGTVSYKIEGNKIMFAVSRASISLASSGKIQFKWADNYQGDDNFWSFYLDGDTAPVGRMNYVYEF